MDEAVRQTLEAEIRRACREGKFDAAVTTAIRGYGPEILGYLHTATGSETDANEVFAMFSEDLWRGVEGFRWESSFRTWAYAVARNAWSRLRREPGRAHGAWQRLSTCPEVQAMAEQVRTTTVVYLRTAEKGRVRRLREQLDPDTRSLLVLRVDRKMSWKEIARVGAGTDDPPPGELDKEAARLRKAFERAKNQLRALAAADGNAGDED